MARLEDARRTLGVHPEFPYMGIRALGHGLEEILQPVVEYGDLMPAPLPFSGEYRSGRSSEPDDAPTTYVGGVRIGSPGKHRTAEIAAGTKAMFGRTSMDLVK
jgi:hypothetical protein